MARPNTLAGLDRWFESVKTRSNDTIHPGAEDGEYAPSEYVSPAIDLVERDEEFVVVVDLPGVDPDAVDVRVEDQELTVVAEPTDALDLEDADVIRSERSHAPAGRTVTFPDPVDPDRTSATMDKGELKVTIGKVVPDSSVRHIDVS